MRFPTLITNIVQGLIITLMGLSGALASYNADMADSVINSNPPEFNLRFDGANAGDALGYYAINTGDFDQDGKTDLLVGARQIDGSTQKGELYLIYATTIESYTSNIIDLSINSNWDIKFIGADIGDQGARVTVVTDFDLDGKDDFSFNSWLADPNGPNSGSTYLIYNTLFSGLQKNSIVDLGSQWSKRIDGVSGSQAGIGFYSTDFDGNDTPDIFISAPMLSPSGAIYFITNELLSSLPNIIDLSSNTSYNVQIQGSGLGDLGSITSADINGDGNQELIAGSINPSIAYVGEAFIIDNATIINAASGATLNLSNSNNYSLKVSGQYLYDALTQGGVYADDLNDNGQTDLFLPASRWGNPNGASGYIIYDDIILNHYANYGNAGNSISLSDTTNWNIRFDTPGILINPGLSFPLERSSHQVEDVDNDGHADVIIGFESETTEQRNKAGEWYVIFNSNISQYTGTGNIVDLTNPSSSDIRYIGASAGDAFGYPSPVFSDINNDGLVDAIAPSYKADNNSGSVYVIHYFPHTIEPNIVNVSLDQAFQFTGTVSAPDNVTTITKVQFGHRPDFGQTENSNDFHTFWWDCDPVDGAFDSNNEQYQCDHVALTDDLTSPFHSPHVVYMRAQDEKGIWTPVSRYAPVLFSAEQMCFPN